MKEHMRKGLYRTKGKKQSNYMKRNGGVHRLENEIDDVVFIAFYHLL